MKHFLLLLLPLLAISFPCIAEDAAQLVYDTENNEVIGGESYYVLPADGSGGGLIMSSTQGRCNYLVSKTHETDVGIPIRFKTPNDRFFRGNILLSTNVTINFHVITTCMQAMYWHVGLSMFSPSHPRGRVAVGNYPVMPLPHGFVFRIEKHNSTTKGYKLVSCAGNGPCKDLGLYASKKTTWLAVSDTPFVVVFKKYIYV